MTPLGARGECPRRYRLDRLDNTTTTPRLYGRPDDALKVESAVRKVACDFTPHHQPTILHNALVDVLNQDAVQQAT